MDHSVAAAERTPAVAAFCILYIVNDFIFIGIVCNIQSQHIGLLQYEFLSGVADSAYIIT